MNKIRRYGIAVIVTHSLVSLLHDLAHRNLGIELSVLQHLSVLIIFVLAPIAAFALLWIRRIYAGVILLLLSMIGAILFAGINHFVLITEDHVMHAPQGTLRFVFQLTAVLMLIIELIGVGVGFWALNRLNKAKIAEVS